MTKKEIIEAINSIPDDVQLVFNLVPIVRNPLTKETKDAFLYVHAIDKDIMRQVLELKIHTKTSIDKDLKVKFTNND